VLCVAIYFARRFVGRSVEVAALFYVATLSPVLGFIMLYTFRYTFVADHYQYLAIIGPVALVSAGFTTLAGSVKYGAQLVRVTSCLILLLLAALTWQQSSMYRDVETLWLTTIARNPRSSVAHNNLGNILYGKGQVDEAIAHYQKASEINPGDAESQYNLGAAFLKKREMNEAILHSQKALEIEPDFPGAHYNLGNAFLAEGDFTRAIASYEAALHLQPNNAIAHDNLAISLVAIGRIGEAIEHFREAIRDDPSFAEAHHNFGYTLMQLGRREEAAAEFAEAVRLKPEYTEAKEKLREMGVQVPER
jgi:tetratricopeptide (TPR) repeat protein